jgi:ATP-dependent DNA helicase RecQ
MLNKFHFSAGYELKSVKDKLLKSCTDENNGLIKYDGLSKALSSFVVKADSDLNSVPENKDNRFAFVMHNLIMRGFPTLASFGLEEDLRKLTGEIVFRESSTKSLEHTVSQDFDVTLLWKALFFIEPRLTRKTAFDNYLKSWENHGSEFEERYLYEELPKQTFDGEGDFLIQLFQPQRSISSILPLGKESGYDESSFKEQQIDFALEYPFPVTENKRKGFCIEIDGSQHEQSQQKYLDKKRDDAVLESGWANTIRIKTKEFNPNDLSSHFKYLNEREFSKQFYKAYFNNYKNPLYKSQEGLKALELVLTPYAVARIQFVLIKAVISGVLSLDEKIWKIAILERDVACARLAIEDLKRFFTAFSNLENKGREFPEIQLEVFFTPEFKSISQRHPKDIPVSAIEQNGKHYDLYIDISVLERDGLSKRNEFIKYDAFIQIRSAFFSPKISQPFLTSERISWGDLVESDGPDKWKNHPVTSNALEFFIQNIFRKKTFREGQLRILDRALKNQTVIGLLPTGGGKSLTYQLAGILQPGHVIVIDPIKSLMKDQVDSLAKIGITGTVYINSALKDFEARQRASYLLTNGHALFCFVSPERMMIERFRSDLAAMKTEKHFFSYGVIDEVHCVSEWGHNFRTPYLSLGKNLMEFCKAADGKIALFGLTATASFDVLSDVQRELSGNDVSQLIPDEAIIRHENTNRDELQYYIEKVELSEEVIADLTENAKGAYFEMKLNEAFGQEKQYRINQILADPGNIIKKFNTYTKEIISKDLIELTYPEGTKPTPNEIHQQIQLPKEAYTGDFWSYTDNEGSNNAALVFAPHKTWYFGVTDKYKSSDKRVAITESIIRANILPEEKVGTFMGVDSDDEINGKRQQEDNDKNQENFISGQQQLMVATKAFGMGIDKPNIRLTIHNNFPDSIESFVQEAGRGGRDRKLSVACVLYNDQSIEDPIKDRIYNHDLDLQESFFWNSFKGEETEKWTLFELLTDIIFPSKNRLSYLSKTLNERLNNSGLDLNIEVRYYSKKNRLYLNGPENEDYGYVDFQNGQLISKWANVDHDLSKKCLYSFYSILRDVAVGIPPEEMEEWINESQGSELKPGIEKVLAAMDYHAEFEIAIPFTNDHYEIYQDLAKFVLKFLNIDQPNSSQIKRYADACKKAFNTNIDKFFENLDKETRILQSLNVKEVEEPETVKSFKNKVSTILLKKRDKQDTEKAIFRFSVIGLIDDYTVDYNSETYLLKGRKKYPEEYHEALRFYISKYYSQKRTDNIINSLHERRGNTEIQRILNFITGFVYKEVAKKRFESISFMQECCKIGLERGNVEMKTWIHLYFNSKYARKGYSVKIEESVLYNFSVLPDKEIVSGEYNASLLDWTQEGQHEEFDFVLDFMHLMEHDEINSERDNLKHLRGACSRLVMANPDNYVFRLLRAFAVLILEEDRLKKNIKEAILTDLKSGYINLFNREGEAFDMDEAMIHYRAAVLDKLQHKNAIDWFLETLEHLEFLAHAEWTNKFKERFTKDLID